MSLSKQVLDCLGSAGKQFGDGVSADEKKISPSNLSKDYEQWQVGQADYAVKLYSFA